MFQSAAGQSTLPPVTVNGSSGGDGSSGSGSTGIGFGGYSGGGGCQSCGGYPEGEFGGSKPAPPPKSAEQKQQEREKCEATRNDSRSELQTSYTAQMGVCASRNSTTFGYFSEQVKQLMNETAGMGVGDCSTNLTRQYYQLLSIYDTRRDVCVAAANKG
jgi:hypothetical protein